MHKVFFEFILQRFAGLKRQLLPYEQLISTLIFPIIASISLKLTSSYFSGLMLIIIIVKNRK